MDILWRKYFQKVSSQSFDILHQSFLYLKHQPGSGTVSSPTSGESGEDFVYTVRNQNLHLLIVFIFHPTELKPNRGVFEFFWTRKQESSRSIKILHQSILSQPGSGAVSSPISGESGEDFVYTVNNQNLLLFIVSISSNRAQTI